MQDILQDFSSPFDIVLIFHLADDMVIYIENPKHYQKNRVIKRFQYGSSYLWRKVLGFWIGRLKIYIEEKCLRIARELEGERIMKDDLP